MTQAPTHRGVVYPWQCDHNGHMNVMHYVGKFDEATWVLFEQVGLTPSFLRDSGRGMVAVEQTLNYRRELLAGDTLSIHSRLLEVGEKSLRFEHVMRKGSEDEAAASTIIKGLLIDLSARRSSPFPADVRAGLEARIES